MAGVLQITLERDGHDQPWGFRLQGGYDVGIPLSIQRVLVGTPAEGVLKKGDVLQKIGTHDVKLLSHQQAADLFTNTGNTIQIFIKRPSAFTTQPAHNVNAHQVVAPPQHVPISGGVALPGLTTITTGRSSETLLSNLSKSRMAPSVSPLNSQPHRTTSPSVPLTIQNQPYRTTQLIQPSAKIEIGPGSAQHLKMQADYITGAKESQISQDSQQARAAEFTMKQKAMKSVRKVTTKTFSPQAGWNSGQVAGSLQQIHQNQTTSPIHNFSEPIFRPAPVVGASHSPIPMQSATPVRGQGKQVYNTPINLYSKENVAEVARFNMMGSIEGPRSPTGLIHPNKPQQVVLTPSKDYNPKNSATWLALQESDSSMDPEKVRAYSSLREHDPVFSEVYTVPKNPQHAPYKPASPHPQAPTIASSNNPSNPHHSARQPGKSTVQSSTSGGHINSPVAELLPSVFRGKVDDGRDEESDVHQSAVMAAALADSKPIDSNTILYETGNIPLYETNAIGGRRRITQSATFNRLMMDVLGE